MKRNKLDELLNNKRKLRAIECNSGLSALIIEKTKIKKIKKKKNMTHYGLAHYVILY